MGRQTKIQEFVNGFGGKKTKVPQKRKRAPISDSSSSESDVARIKLKKRPPTTKENSLIVIESDNDSETLPAIKRTPRTGAYATQVKSRSASSVTSDQEAASEESEGKQQRVIQHSLRKRKLSSTQIVLDSDDEDLTPTKKRRVLKKGLRPESDEDEDLTKELDQEVIIETRFRDHGKKSAFSKNLEKRKRQRMGLPAPKSESSTDSDDSGFVPIPGARLGETSSASDEDSEEDFIVEDEDANVTVALPMQYSSERAQSLSVHFKIVFQLLVHIACMPPHLRKAGMMRRLQGEDENSEYFNNSLSSLRRKLSAIRDSQVTSSVWSNEYKQRLDEYPELEITMMAPTEFCLACRKRNAISTRECRLSGEPYERIGYQPITSGSSSSSSSSPSSESESDGSESSLEEDTEDGGQSPKPWQLGQYCARRTRLYHSLSHWEWSLFRYLETQIEKYEAIKKKVRKRGSTESMAILHDPDKVTEWLERKNCIKEQWDIIRNMINEAQNIEKRNPNEID